MGDLVYDYILTKHGRMSLTWQSIPPKARQALIQSVSQMLSARHTHRAITLPTGQIIHLRAYAMRPMCVDSFVIAPETASDQFALEKHYGDF